ncbi:hypothetical protein C6P40_002775 [Pichia californica]|uniref:Calponin-homology (CH) domain-containing protein n=1 Tax=Pichia californica TaxID=460514 RepID=A0A9P7BFB8_9ASCO|nr:hypothetical protein C6P42_003231 [[Candida] californica]KAG0687168.1 hypothetical protein C6P40_002775 [[Candida] californica]
MSGNQNQDATTNIDQDLKISRLGKYNNNKLQTEVKEWIFSIIGNEIEDNELILRDDLMKTLKDGSILCILINKTFGEGSIKFKKSKLAFVQMENIEKFLNFCKINGVSQDELFQTIDLYEEKDPYQVIMSLQSLSRVINNKFPNKYSLIGPNISKKHERPKVPNKPKHLVMGQGGVPWSSIEYGYMNGSNQAKEGVVFGGRRDIINK